MEDEAKVKFLLAFVGSTLNMKPDDVDKVVLKGEKDGLAELKEKFDSFVDEKFEDGQTKVVGMFKKAYKSVYGSEPTLTNPTELKGVLKQLKTDAETEAGESGKNVDDEAVKNSELYKKLKTEFDQKEEEIETIKTTHEKQLLNRDMTQKAISYLGTHKAIIPSDEGAAKTKEKFYLGELLQFGFDTSDKDKVYLKDAEGNYVLNGNKHKVTLEDKAKELINHLYGVQQVQQRDNSNPKGNNNPTGDQNNGNGSMKHFKGQLPKTLTEYHNLLTDTRLNGLEKGDVMDYWREQQNQPA